VSGRGWWIDDDGFLHHPDNVQAFTIDDAVPMLDTLTAENARLREALARIGELLSDGSCSVCGISNDSGRCGCPDGTIKPHEQIARAALATKGGQGWTDQDDLDRGDTPGTGKGL
jgi:hypothetical protein